MLKEPLIHSLVADHWTSHAFLASSSHWGTQQQSWKGAWIGDVLPEDFGREPKPQFAADRCLALGLAAATAGTQAVLNPLNLPLTPKHPAPWVKAVGLPATPGSVRQTKSTKTRHHLFQNALWPP